nr:retrovirus-related Pol polyprotein from transposon TNT 1-94 [Tanacetum cinerariifolium]
MVEKSKLDEDKEGKAVDPSHYRAFADADHAGCQDTRRSTYGSVQFLRERLISWSSKRQKSAAISSTKVEYIALSGCCAQILWIYHFIKEQVENGVIELYFVNTEYQLVDLFTKALGKDRIEFLINKLGMRSFTPETLKQLMNETIDTTIEQQVAMNEALVPHAQRLRIGRSNFRLLSNIKSKESTLQLVYDVLRICPFFKAFMVTADVPEIYMQELWTTATVRHHAIRFKMDNKKHIVNLESFRDMLHICLRVPGQSFDEPPFEEEILAFIWFLGHSVAIRTLTDVNINKLYQPWRSFAAIINKCLTRKSSGYDSLRLSQAQILWGLYHKRNVDYAYLMWEDFVFQVEHKNQKKSNEMYYPRFTKVIIHHFMSKDPSIPRRNKVNWHYVRDDLMFSTIKLYYAVATGAAPPKPKASVRRTRSSSDTSITPPTAAAGPRLTTTQKDEGTGSIPGVPDVPTDESEEELSWNSTDDECAGDEGKDDDDDENDNREEGDDDDDDYEVVRDDDKDDEEEGGGDEHEYAKEESDEETRDEESFDPISQTPENSEDEGDDVNINHGKGIQANLEVEDSHVALTPVNPDGQQQSSSVSSQFVTNMLNPTLDVGMESIFETTSQLDVQTPTSVAPLPMSAPTMTPSTIDTITITSQVPILPTTVSSDIIQNLPNFGSLFCFDDRLRSLEANFSEFRQTNQFAGAVSFIPRIVNRYMDQRMNEAVKVAPDHLHKEAQKENDEFLKFVDENMKKIIKEQVKDQVKKIEGNKSIQCSDEQRNLYKALVEAYESDEIILDKYGETVTLKRRRDDDSDKNEEPSAGPDRGSKRRREGKEPESKPPTLDRDWNKTLPAVHGRIQPWISKLAKQADTRSSFNELMDTPLDFSNFLINWLKVDTLTLELLESARDVYSKRRIIAVTELKIVEWYSYKHLDWITVRRDDDKIYKFKEGDFKRLRIQDIEDMLLLLVQGKLTNLTVEERFAFNVSLRMFTRSIVIQRHVEDLQLGVESYQKKLNLTKPDSYRSDLKCKEAYTAYSNPRGFIY